MSWIAGSIRSRFFMAEANGACPSIPCKKDRECKNCLQKLSASVLLRILFYKNRHLSHVFAAPSLLFSLDKRKHNVPNKEESMNNRKRSWLEKCLVVFGLATLMMLSLTSTVQAQANDDEGEPEFELVTLYLEFNPTDNEAEVVTVVDAEVGLKVLKVIAPNDKTVLSLTSKNTPNLGQGEVLVKTPELSLDEIKAVYPAGVYRFRGTTVDDGDRVIGEVTLSHELLAAPVISTRATGQPGFQ